MLPLCAWEWILSAKALGMEFCKRLPCLNMHFTLPQKNWRAVNGEHSRQILSFQQKILLTVVFLRARLIATKEFGGNFPKKVKTQMDTDTSVLQQWLDDYLRSHGAVAGTIHVRQGNGLALSAAVNIPPPVAEIVRWVPWGKGMAGMALETGEAVTTCNLKEEASGRVKPGAKAVSAQAAVALPIKNSSLEVIAVLGIAFQEERTIDPMEIARLLADAADIPIAPEVHV